jgi:glutamyl-tRNA synthetase/nondiscriminating glutamyl-tRNA synthetase
LGNARTALLSHLAARKAGGRFILRVEDTDEARSTEEFMVALFADLKWLGIDWDEGPDIGGPRGPYRQTERLDIYRAHANRLLASDQAYYCFCSKEKIEADRQAALAAGRAAGYPGTCRAIPPDEAQARHGAGEPAAIRFRVPPARDVVFHDAVRGEVRFNTGVIGDPVLVRSEGVPAYNFAVVVDDALMGVTQVIRGEDHISNTPRQILFYEALGYTPPQFAHLAMVMGPDHTKLSKRHGATSVSEFREKGYLPEALVNYLALVGWSPRVSAQDKDDSELMPIAELARRFSLEHVSLSAGVFDEEKLAWVNRHYLKAASSARLAQLSVPFFRAAGMRLDPGPEAMAFLASVLPIATGSVDRLDQVPARLDFLFDYSPRAALSVDSVREEMSAGGARSVAGALVDEIGNEPLLDRERFRAVANAVKARTGQKGKALFHPIRIVLMGKPDGPELDLAVPAIDRGAALGVDAGLPPIMSCRDRARAFLDALRGGYYP